MLPVWALAASEVGAGERSEARPVRSGDHQEIREGMTIATNTLALGLVSTYGRAIATEIATAILAATNEEPFDRFARLVAAMPFQVAVTMPENPHSYTLRRKWDDDADFVFCVNFIRSDGYKARFGRYDFPQLDCGEFFYWTMYDDIKDTALFNRKPLSQKGVPRR